MATKRRSTAEGKAITAKRLKPSLAKPRVQSTSHSNSELTSKSFASSSINPQCSLAKIPVTTDPLQLVGEAHDSPPLTRKDLSSRGLARGVVDSQLRNKLPCVIFGEAYPCWLAFASQLGYDPVLVVLESEDHLATVHASVPDHCAVIASDDWTALVAKLPHFVHRSAIVLVDGRVSQNILDLAELMQVTTVVGTALARRPVKGWHQAVSRIDHSLVGGVTHTQVHVVACTLHGNGTVPTPSATATIPRDLSSVLTDVQGGIPRQAPLHRRLSSGEVVNVRPNGAHPVYHGMGWLPANPKRSTKVLTPSVFVTRGSKWALRSITDVEFLAIYDYPERLVEILLPKLEDKSFPNLQPGKALLTGACSVLNQLSKLVNEGGGNFLSPPLISHKRRFHEIVLPDSEPQPQSKASKTGNSAVMEVNPLPSSIPSIGLVEVSSILDEVSKDKRERKATKADDAEVPISMWTDHYLEESTLKWNSSDKSSIEKAMDTMRKYLLERWKRRVLNSYLKWYYEEGRRPRCQACEHWVEWTRKDEEDDNKERVEYRWTNQGRFEYAKWYKERKDGDPLELEAGSDAVCRALLSSWWEWEDGSRPFHWRWPAWYRRSIRDGLEVFLDGDPPVYTKAQRKEKDPKIRDEMIKKLAKVRARRYIAKGTVVSLTSYFAVPKGESDIRMVYDGTKSGLNDAMWVPRFGLPTIDTHLRSIEEGTFLADVDVGECFLNFPLHHSLRKLAGVDFTHYFPDPSKSKVWECWHRALMGCKSSPFQAVQGMTVAEEVIRGQPEDPHNVFRWSQVRLNLPGDPSYDPSKPWVSKVREEETIAADLVGYVDDLRTSGPDRKEAWHAAKRTASVLNYLGIQDAPRKRRDSSRTPGAWSGSVVVTKDDGVYVTADSEKWNKAKGMVEEVIAMIAHDRKRLNRKRLEEIRGFLNYVVRTYPALKPYLTGLHLTIDGWRADRDPEGWRLKNRKGKRKIWNGINSASFSSEKFLSVASNTAPTEVEAKERLPQDMLALRYLMEGSSPLLRRVRSRIGRTVVYSFGDASSSGFGITLEVEGKIYYEYGQWDESADGQSSNWREATNLLEGLRRAIHDHALEGLEVFIFTDNTTAESTYWKGWSRDKALSDIVLEMRKLEMEHDIVLHIIHVSGSRMIRQGTDGLSRADHSNGVMNGEDMTRHVPLNESAFERSPELLHRFNTMFPGLELQLLEPRAWYDEYHNYGNFVWCPPPAAADVVVDLLNKARHKRPESMHIILVPRLMTGRWRRLLTRTSDFYFRINWIDSWDTKVHHEPLLCFICLPFSLSNPNLRERESLLDEMGRVLLQPELHKKSDSEKWNLLRELLCRARALCSLPTSFLC